MSSGDRLRKITQLYCVLKLDVLLNGVLSMLTLCQTSTLSALVNTSYKQQLTIEAEFQNLFPYSIDFVVLRVL